MTIRKQPATMRTIFIISELTFVRTKKNCGRRNSPGKTSISCSYTRLHLLLEKMYSSWNRTIWVLIVRYILPGYELSVTFHISIGPSSSSGDTLNSSEMLESKMAHGSCSWLSRPPCPAENLYCDYYRVYNRNFSIVSLLCFGPL